MALRTFVKISQVNNLSDARYCAGMGVALLGFNLEPGTVHYVAPEKFRELSDWVAGVDFVAEFAQASPETIIRLLPEYPVHYIQTDVEEYLVPLQSLNLPLILRIPVSPSTSPESVAAILARHQHKVAFFILESISEVELDKAMINKLLLLSNENQVLVDFGSDAPSIDQMLKTYPLKGIALKGGEEIRVGYKDFDELAEILESLEVDDAY